MRLALWQAGRVPHAYTEAGLAKATLIADNSPQLKRKLVLHLQYTRVRRASTVLSNVCLCLYSLSFVRDFVKCTSMLAISLLRTLYSVEIRSHYSGDLGGKAACSSGLIISLCSTILPLVSPVLQPSPAEATSTLRVPVTTSPSHAAPSSASP